MGSHIYGQNWSKMLAESGLETPGYREAVEATAKKTAERKARQAAGLEKKTKRKGKRK